MRETIYGVSSQQVFVHGAMAKYLHASPSLRETFANDHIVREHGKLLKASLDHTVRTRFGEGSGGEGKDLVCRAMHYSAKMWAMYETKLNQRLERDLPKPQSLLSRHSNFSKSSTSHAMRKPPCESYPNSSSLCFNRTRNASLCKYSV